MVDAENPSNDGNTINMASKTTEFGREDLTESGNKKVSDNDTDTVENIVADEASTSIVTAKKRINNPYHRGVQKSSIHPSFRNSDTDNDPNHGNKDRINDSDRLGRVLIDRTVFSSTSMSSNASNSNKTNSTSSNDTNSNELKNDNSHKNKKGDEGTNETNTSKKSSANEV